MSRSLFLPLVAVFLLMDWSAGTSSSLAGNTEGSDTTPPVRELKLKGARSEVYKTINDVSLKIHIYEPEGHQPTDSRPAIVFFFGGAWANGSPRQFSQHCQYLASRGMVAMTADYRVRSRHKTRIEASVRDALTAMRWIRGNAQRLGIDPNRLAAGGGSAGGHLAACTATIPNFRERGEPLTINPVPNALILFNPLMSTVHIADGATEGDVWLNQLEGRFNGDPQRISPAHHVHQDVPPTIMFFGTADVLGSFAEYYCEQVSPFAKQCNIEWYEGEKHGFFNYRPKEPESFLLTVQKADDFLVQLGWLEEGGNVREWLANNNSP